MLDTPCPCGPRRGLTDRSHALNPLEQRLRGRGINFLMHFTRAENIPSIMEHGLQPRALLDQAQHPYHFTDSWRNDGFLSAISLSVSSYNWHMFSAVRRRDPGRHWVVLAIDPMILVGRTCRFHASNAASGQYGRSSRSYRDLRSFDEMFEDFCRYGGFRGQSYRTECEIPDYLPTDPQAEVLAFGGIAPEHILFAMAERADVAEWVDGLMRALPGPERDVVHGPFQPRYRTPYALWG